MIFCQLNLDAFTLGDILAWLAILSCYIYEHIVTVLLEILPGC